MRTFHIGGAAQKGSEISSIESNTEGDVKFINVKIAQDSNNNSINLSRSSQLCIFQGDKEKARHRIPFGSKINVKEGQKIQKVAAIFQYFNFLLLSF